MKQDTLAELWDDEREVKYIEANSDVAEAVATGSFTSGKEHFISCGFQENRPGAPSISSGQLTLLREAVSNLYWQSREDSVYLSQSKCLSQFIARCCRSVIDVGSNGCPVLEWFPLLERRVSIDIQLPYAAKGIKSIKGDFIEFRPDCIFDLGLWLQVLEHVPDAAQFAQKLLSVCKHLIVSVPYNWEVNANTLTIGHIHDPVDEEKMRQWFDRAPDFQMVCKEREAGIQRLICYYERKKQ
jgi:hypothetical protein